MPLQAVTLDSLPDWQPPDQPSESAPTNVQPAATVDPRTGRPVVQVYRQNPSLQDLPEWQPPAPQEPARQVGTGEAVLTGLKSGLTFGFEPEYQGMSEAGNEVLKRIVPEQYAEHLRYVPSPIKAHIGAAVRLAEWASNHDDPEVAAAAERGRKFAQETVDLSKEQHPWGFYSGMIGGSLMLPGFGPEITAARIAKGAVPAIERVASGVAQGGLYGGLQGTGEAVSEGKGLPEVARSAVKGTVFGAGVGGALHGAVGPRGTPAVPTQGQRAAATAERLVGEPVLPKGVASDIPAVQQATAWAQSLPLGAGARITNRVRRVQESAGEHVEGIAQGMTRGGGGRTVSDTAVRRGLEKVIERNRAVQDAGYDRLRAMLPHGGEAEIHSLRRTRAVLDHVAERRRKAGIENPEVGLERFRKLQDVASFNGTQRLRTWASNQTKPGIDNPGFDAGDYRAIAGAMSADMREAVANGARAAGNDPRRALQAFEEADARFGALAEQNKILRGIAEQRGEGAISKLTAAAKEKGGDARLLQQMRRQMPPQEFEHVGGTILSELGQRTAQGGESQFSLQQFSKRWGDLSDAAKSALFSPAHRHDIDEIVDMGRHINRALEQTNRSHTGGVIVAFETLHTLAELAIGAGAGWVTGGEVAMGIGGIAAPAVAALILASPARAASTRAFMTAYNGWLRGPTPARTAVFKLATRNVAKNLGFDPSNLVRLIETKGTGKAEPDESSRGEKH